MKDYAFLSSSAPNGGANESRSVTSRFTGIDLSEKDGSLTALQNMEITPSGTLRTSETPKTLPFGASGTPLCFFAHGGYLFLAVNTGKNKVELIRFDENGNKESVVLSSSASLSGTLRSIVSYSSWTGESDIIGGSYEDVLLIFPDKKVIRTDGAWTSVSDIARYDIYRTVTTKTLVTEKSYNSGWEQNEDGSYTLPPQPDGVKRELDTKEEVSLYCSQANDTLPEEIEHPAVVSTAYSKSDVYNMEGEKVGVTLFVTETKVTVTETFSAELCENAIPNAERVTVSGTRVFGVDGSKIFAGGVSSYADYELDTASSYDENGAWYCATAGDAFTALTVFDGRVTAFKPQGLYQLYNTKNPFRVREISKEGTSFPDTVCTSESALYFANASGIFSFTGAYPRNVSSGKIDMKRFYGKKACAGAFGGKYYFRRASDFDDAFLSAGTKPIFIYDSGSGAWSIRNHTDTEIAFFASSAEALYAVLSDGTLISYAEGSRKKTPWFAELPVDCGDSADVKHLSRVQAVFRFRGNANVKISVALDNGDFLEIGTLEGGDGYHPFRCQITAGDHVVRRIRLEGQGDVELLRLEQFFRAGGIRYGE